MQPAPPALYAHMDSIYKTLENELKITMDLDGDNFIFEVILPGVLLSTNADSLLGDTLLWSFELRDYMNDDYVMTAESSISYPERQKAGMALFLILGILFIRIRMRYKRSN